MGAKRMLIDASHPEETRVVVLDGTRLEAYDVEVASRRQLKGNIYLAKVTRVEPSLQAAFVDYGGNRHGFLAFSEIHPDYYQIPVADRQAILAEQQAEDKAAEGLAIAEGTSEEAEGVDIVTNDDDEELERRRARSSPRNYKIQEVIKRRQIMLVQVVKEERGTKGAALTTYLSLAGRYCVLMPNTTRGGGISRKITNATDRKRLKVILNELEVPEGMAVIVRTAGAGRSKAEIKRDYEYLLRLWSSIREVTLHSMAPTLVYEEGSLIKRSIRDLYERDIEEIVVLGEKEYRTAKEFMKLFIPSHAKRVKLYDSPDKPLFQQYQLESQLDAMHQPLVQLKSGGYIVINPTEALVAIDVNSGRATRERHIEETALRTNLEAADEIARQLRLRDLAGLIVVDFIDMENPRNQSLVERRLKEAMKNDRARVQLGRISPFGLLELSRQRLRPSLLETSFETCLNCAGTGLRRTTESTALAILRKIEEEGINHRSSEITVSVPTAVAMYLLNQKRKSLAELEARYGFVVSIAVDETLVPPDHRVERVKVTSPSAEAEVAETAESDREKEEAEAGMPSTDREEPGKRGRRRKSRRRKRGEEGREPSTERREAEVEVLTEALDDDRGSELDRDSESDHELEQEQELDQEQDQEESEQLAEASRKRRRRGKRGGRRRSRKPTETEIEAGESEVSERAGGGEEQSSAGAAPIADGDTDADERPPSEAVVERPTEDEPGVSEPSRLPAPDEAAAESAPYGNPSHESDPEVSEIAQNTEGFGAADVQSFGSDANISAEGRLQEGPHQTRVIHVGVGADHTLRDIPRRGWWQRLIS